jgi:hypothetical protein
VTTTPSPDRPTSYAIVHAPNLDTAIGIATTSPARRTGATITVCEDLDAPSPEP